MKRAGILAALFVAVFLLLPGAVAHGPGGVSTHLEGSLSLAPSGTAGDTALLALSDLGEVDAGEEFRYFWEANAGEGPAVRFAILQELPGSGPVPVYGMMAATATETWMIPARAEYTASWENPTGEAVTVSYLFEVLPPVASPAIVDWPLYLGLGVAGVVFAFLFFWSGRRKRETDPSEAGDETDPQDR
ncbi:MAG: hypothetical protein ACE5I4_00970 [Thermoplasmata archaeon]